MGSKCDERVDNQTCHENLKNQSCDKSSSSKILMDSNSNQAEQACKQDEAEVINQSHNLIPREIAIDSDTQPTYKATTPVYIIDGTSKELIGNKAEPIGDTSCSMQKI